MTINGTTAGTNYDQLAAGGTVNLASATLNVSIGSFTPAAGEQFTILHNTSGSAITGTFAGLTEGAILTVGAPTSRSATRGGPTARTWC